ncbi:tigger transposable element-derived protein 4-like [Octopus bimaculoides]|uniref:tigger transposable element-derived protein 4-like n=1 Tax=Octopus bimaculoides TaxID=37653 RepID=UPI00071C5E09|nr:tigger transposable element-derived protein 4-like [Octopus bimaculoides]|eukprot:XP_014771693.1 PREDICTED: tigger transposable element-derived protein 4-like [Octopus bimaculoides]
MPLLAIGKSAKLLAFKNFPAMHQANKKAWLRGDIFESEMRNFNRRMRNVNRKVAMIVDNCSARPQIELENVELIFLSPNTTSVMQSMDAVTIKDLKFHYRKILAGRRLAAAENNQDFKWDILDCLLVVKFSWTMVKCETVRNYWKKVSFVKQPANESAEETSGVRIGDNEIQDDDDDDHTVFRNIWDRLNNIWGVELSLLDVNIDSADVSTTEDWTDEEIVAELRSSADDTC